MGALFAKFGIGLSKTTIVALAALALVALIALGSWRAVAGFRAILDDVRREAIAARDAHWSAEIERSNAQVEARRADQAIEAARRDAAARAQIESLTDQLAMMEMENAKLPEGPGGLKRDRVRLLPR